MEYKKSAFVKTMMARAKSHISSNYLKEDIRYSKESAAYSYVIRTFGRWLAMEGRDDILNSHVIYKVDKPLLLKFMKYLILSKKNEAESVLLEH